MREIKESKEEKNRQEIIVTPPSNLRVHPFPPHPVKKFTTIESLLQFYRCFESSIV